MEPKICGWKQETPLDTDNVFDPISNKMFYVGQTSSGVVLSEKTPISNQLSLSSCVANATVDSLEILNGIKDPDSVVQLSRLFTYFNARNYDNDISVDGGTYIRRAFQSLTEFGVCPEDDWPYVESRVNTQPSLNCYRTASDNRINDFYRITGDGSSRSDAIVVALESSHPVVFGAAINRDFIYHNNGGVVYQPSSTIGRHAMVIVGWKKDPDLRFYVRNSWGSSWGDGSGHCWFDAKYIENGDMCSDFWVPTIGSPNLY